MGERIGGSHLLTKVGSQSRNSIAIDHLSLKKGSVGEGGQKNKVRWQTTRSKRGDHVGQADKQNGTGVQGDEPRRTGARTFQNGLVGVGFLGCPGLPALGGQKKKNIGN